MYHLEEVWPADVAGGRDLAGAELLGVGGVARGPVRCAVRWMGTARYVGFAAAQSRESGTP